MKKIRIILLIFALFVTTVLALLFINDKMNNKVFCTVFTPAYNRKELLYRLYESLVEQTSKDFEWVIIDDGSTDGTDDMIASIKEDSFSIIYKKVENGGKHRAINRGLDIAEGEVFAIVDSDDYLR